MKTKVNLEQMEAELEGEKKIIASCDRVANVQWVFIWVGFGMLVGSTLIRLVEHDPKGGVMLCLIALACHIIAVCLGIINLTRQRGVLRRCADRQLLLNAMNNEVDE